MVQLSHWYMTTGKTIGLTIHTFDGKWCLCFLICCLGLSQLSSKEQLFLFCFVLFCFTTAVTIHSDFGAQEKKICHCFHFFPIFHEVMGLDAKILAFLILHFKSALPLSFFTIISLIPINVCSNKLLKILTCHRLSFIKCFCIDFPRGSDSKASAYSVGDLGSIPGLGRSPGEGNGNPLQYSCLENPMDGGTW